MPNLRNFRAFWVLAGFAATGLCTAASAAPMLRSGSDPGRIELATGALIDLSLPAGATLDAVAGTDASWIAAGTRPRKVHGEDEVRRELFVILGQGADGPRRTLPSLQTTEPLQARPMPLAVDGKLAGLAWLEGADPRSLAVKAARFKNGRWSHPQTIAPKGPGSQVGLVSARLDDGTYLLAWSAFDGQDDEILWSHGRPGSAWTHPRPAAPGNRVPDITPALVATADGALLAWARFDGDDYRVVSAAFSRDRWNAAKTVGPAGSVFPTLERTADGACLLARTAAPRGWEAIEMDGAGKPLRRASIADTPDSPAAGRSDRPRLAATVSALTFRWPAGAPGAAPAELSARWSEEP